MKMFKAFNKDESGAVTMDWVVLSGIVIAFALAVATLSGDGGSLATAVGNIGTDLTENTTN